MTREEAIRCFEKLLLHVDTNAVMGTETTEAINMAIKALEQPESQWIPCSERLPNVRQWVLCQCRARIMDVLRLTADGSWNKNYPYTEYMSGFVVAWMPLPEPWKEGEANGN